MASTAASNGGLPPLSTFSFKAPLPASSSSAATASALKHRRVSLASQSSPRVVQAWNFRDDTGIDANAASSSSPVLEKRGKIRKIDMSLDAEEKKPRKKWSAEETQMLVDGCQKHGVGNWKTILQDPALTFHERSAVDLKDRFRTYFPDAYRQHYPNARTHLSSKVRSTLPDGSSLFEKTRSKRRRPFTEEEDKALKAGYEKHGTTWATIVKDPIFQEQNRRSTDLRDRFRNAFPLLYQAAGYKPRSSISTKKKMGLTDGKRAATDDQLNTTTSGGAGPVRSRRRAQTSQGLLRGGTKSVPQSNACSEDEDSSAGEEESEPSRSVVFKTPPLPVFVDNVSTTSSRMKKPAIDSFIMVSDDHTQHRTVHDDIDDDEMVTLESLTIPDFTPSEAHEEMDGNTPWSSGVDTPTHSSTHAWSATGASPASSHISDYLMAGAPSQHSPPFLTRRQDQDLHGGSNMIGKSAWGTQDWFSPNPRLDTGSAAGAGTSSFMNDNNGNFSPTSPFSFHPHGVMDRYDLFPSSAPLHDIDISSEIGDMHSHHYHNNHNHHAYNNANNTTSASASAFSDEMGMEGGSSGFKGYHSQIAGDLISGNRVSMYPGQAVPFSSLYGLSSSSAHNNGTPNGEGMGLGLLGLGLSDPNGTRGTSGAGGPAGSSSLHAIDELGLTGISLEDHLELGTTEVVMDSADSPGLVAMDEDENPRRGVVVEGQVSRHGRHLSLSASPQGSSPPSSSQPSNSSPVPPSSRNPHIYPSKREAPADESTRLSSSSATSTDQFTLSDLVVDDLANDSSESHATPPATPVISNPRPLRRSSGSMLHHYGDGASLHARSISVPPSEARHGVGESPFMWVEGTRGGAITPPAGMSYGGGGSGFIAGGRGLGMSEPISMRLSSSTGSIQSRTISPPPQAAMGSGRQEPKQQQHQQPTTVFPGNLLLTPSSTATSVATNVASEAPMNGNPTSPTSAAPSANHSNRAYTSNNSITSGDFYNLPFLDLHYYGHYTSYANPNTNPNTLNGLGDEFWGAQMDGTRQGQALDLAQSAVSASSASSHPHSAPSSAAMNVSGIGLGLGSSGLGMVGSSTTGFGINLPSKMLDPNATIRGGSFNRYQRSHNTHPHQLAQHQHHADKNPSALPLSSVLAPPGSSDASQDPYASVAAAVLAAAASTNDVNVGASAAVGANGRGAATIGRSAMKSTSGLGRSVSHHRGQSAVCPQDLMLRNDNKRKRASWDGGLV